MLIPNLFIIYAYLFNHVNVSHKMMIFSLRCLTDNIIKHNTDMSVVHNIFCYEFGYDMQWME